jgi:hypothetical protein
MRGFTGTSGPGFEKIDPVFRKTVTWGDGVFLGVLLCLSLSAYFLLSPLTSRKGEVWIYENGKVFGYYSLNVDRTVKVRGPLGVTVVTIRHGEAAITSAPCPHKLCEKMGPIPRRGSVMICIPNRIIVEVKGKKRRSPDAITR